VDLAEDGEKGSFLARTNEYDLIILDEIQAVTENNTEPLFNGKIKLIFIFFH
jgi:hypothetical protein